MSAVPVPPPTAADLADAQRELREREVVYRGEQLRNDNGQVSDGSRQRLLDAAIAARDLVADVEERNPDLLQDFPDLRADIVEAELLAAGELPPGKKSKETHAQAVIRLGSEADLFKTPGGELFATYRVAGHVETAPLRSSELRRWLVREFHNGHGKPPQASAVTSALEVLEGRAQYGGREREVHTRVAEHNGAVYIDVGDASWEAIEVTSHGYAPAPTPPVCFRRSRGLRPLPEPKDGGSLDLLRPYVNVGSDEAWKLVVGWLVAAAMPAGPYPVLVLHGQRGSAKSTATRYLRSIIDPSQAPTRDAPREPRDLAIAARNARVVAFDNLSGLPAWLSDALCRVATGAGFGTRKLYENDEEVVFWDTRPIVVNGIEELATRGDLLDRSIVVDLPRISEGERRTERELDEQFRSDHPLILGALLEAVSCSLRRLDDVRLDRLPRMADFARRVEAAAPALGWAPGEFLKVYAKNRDSAVDIEIEASMVGTAMLALVDRRAGAEWKGPASDLLGELSMRMPPERQPRDWPTTAKGLHGALKRIAPALEARGVVLDLGYRESNTNRARRIVVSTSDTWEATSDTCRTHSDPECVQPESASPRENGPDPDSSDTLDTSDPPLSPAHLSGKEKAEGHESGVGRNVSNVSNVSASAMGGVR